MLVACGVSLSSDDDDSELFKRLSVEGDFRAGGALLVKLEYEQPYPVAVEVLCQLLDPGKKARSTRPAKDATPTPISIPPVLPTPENLVGDVIDENLPANTEGGAAGEATPAPGVIERQITAPNPGRYRIECFTPGDVDNDISTTITIVRASQPPP